MMKVILTLFLLLRCSTCFAADWQSPWQIEKDNIKKLCELRYDKKLYLTYKDYGHDSFLTTCIRKEKEAYEVMQDDFHEVMQNRFGLSSTKADALRNSCSKKFDSFWRQLSCVKHKSGKLVDEKTIKLCDINEDGMISGRHDVVIGIISVEVAKKEHRCKLAIELEQSERELEQSERELEQSERELEQLKQIRLLLEGDTQ